jgi:hypothetical protein
LGQGRCQQLQDDRSVNERENSEGKDSQRGDTSTCEDVEEANQLPSLLDELLEGHTVDPWHGDVDAEAHQHQQTQSGENPAAQLRILHQLGDDFSGTGVASPTDEHETESVGLGLMQESRPRIEILRTAQTLELGGMTLKGLTQEVRRFHRLLRSWCGLMP